MMTRMHPLAKVFGSLTDAIAKPGCIRILVDHEGGDLEEGFRIYETLKALGERVEGVVIGNAVSSAAIALMGCSKRLMLRGSSLRFHFPARYNSLEIFLSEDLMQKNRQSALATLRRVEESIIFATGGKMNKDQARALLKEDRKVFLDEALELGLVHGVADTL
jgi:ATP-dependent protease ClpP protease subunit